MTQEELDKKLRELQQLYDAYIAEGRPFEWGPMRAWHDAIDDAFPELREALAEVRAMREALDHTLVAMTTTREYVPDSRPYLSIELEWQINKALGEGAKQ